MPSSISELRALPCPRNHLRSAAFVVHCRALLHGPFLLVGKFALQHCPGHVVQHGNRLSAGLYVGGPVRRQRWPVFPKVRDCIPYALAKILLPYGGELLSQVRVECLAHHFVV